MRICGGPAWSKRGPAAAAPCLAAGAPVAASWAASSNASAGFVFFLYFAIDNAVARLSLGVASRAAFERRERHDSE